MDNVNAISFDNESVTKVMEGTSHSSNFEAILRSCGVSFGGATVSDW